MSTKNEGQKRSEKKPLAVEVRYPREEILANPSAFNVRAEVLAGALSMLPGNEFTRRQVVDAIENFKKRKV